MLQASRALSKACPTKSQPHNLKVASSNLAPATKLIPLTQLVNRIFPFGILKLPRVLICAPEIVLFAKFAL